MDAIGRQVNAMERTYLDRLDRRIRRQLVRFFIREVDAKVPPGPLGKDKNARRQLALRLAEEAAKEIIESRGPEPRQGRPPSDAWLRVATIWLEPHLANVALLFLKTEVDKARLQFKRIREDERQLQSLHAPPMATRRWMDEGYQKERHEVMTALFADIHFLLVCLDKLDLYLRMLRKYLPKEQEIAAVQKRYKRLLKEADDFRNHLEHMDKRIEEGVSDLGNLIDSMFSFGGRTFEIGPSREAEVQAFYEDLLRAAEAVARRQRARRDDSSSPSRGGAAKS